MDTSPDPTSTSLLPRAALAAVLAYVVALVPLCFLGAGTDLDAGAVLQAGRSILDGTYLASRAPGAPVHETLAGLLDAVGGVWAVNLLSLLAAAVVLIGLMRLGVGESLPRPWLVAAFVAANPWFQIASTSTVDFVLSAALLVAGAFALRRGNVVIAGLLCGAAIGARMSSGLWVVALVVAELTGRGARRESRALRLTVVSGIVGVLCFVPPFRAASNSLSFVQNDFRTESPLTHVGRAAVKNLVYLGPFTVVALLLAVPAVWALRHQWRDRWLVRFATVGFVLFELLFVRFPWKVGHLIPAMICLALLLGEALREKPKLFVALVALQLAMGFVNVELFRPDIPNQAERAQLSVRVRPGPLIVDTRCRVQDRDAAESNDLGRIEDRWNCARPWGSGP